MFRLSISNISRIKLKNNMFIWSINTSLYLHVRVCEIQELKTENEALW